MKYRVWALILCAACLLTMTACGSGEDMISSTAAVPAEAPAAFGDASIAQTPVQEAETTSLPDSSFSVPASAEAEPSEEASADSEVPAQYMDYTELAVKAILVCDAVDRLPYNPDGDDMYFWRSIGYLIGEMGAQEGLIDMEGPQGKIRKQDAAIFAQAISATFSGEFPVVTLEDPFITPADDDTLLITMHPQEDLEIRMTENRYSAEGDTFVEEAELLQNGETLGLYTVTLTNYTGTDSLGQSFFGYSIVSLEAHN